MIGLKSYLIIRMKCQNLAFNLQAVRILAFWWAHLGSNQGPTGYEPVALPLSYRPKLAYKIILKILAHVN